MGFTLRIIFYGLIAFAPNGPGMHAVVVDSQTVNPLPPAISFPEHQVRGWVLKGRCEAGCTGDDAFEIPKGVRISIDGGLSGLVEPVLGRRDLPGGGWRVYPQTQEQSSDFTWVTPLGELDSSAGVLYGECAKSPNSCPIHAIFEIDRGRISACHLIHGPKDGKLRIFRYKSRMGPGSTSDLVQAAADAILVEIGGLRDEVTLTKTRFGENTTEQDNLVEVTPDQDNVVTIIIANYRPPSQAASGPIIDSHFEAYYQLAGSMIPAHSKRIPFENGTVAKTEFNPYHLACEEDMDELAMRICAQHLHVQSRVCNQVVPHSVEACATAQFYETGSAESVSGGGVAAAATLGAEERRARSRERPRPQ